MVNDYAPCLTESDMNQIELDSYLLALKNGSLSMVREALMTICEVEGSVPEVLIRAVIDAVRRHGFRSAEYLSVPIGWFFQITQSMELFTWANKMGYFSNVPLGHYLDLRVWLFAAEKRYTPDVEEAAIDELYIWMIVADHWVRDDYEADVQEKSGLEGRLYGKIRRSDFYSRPLRPVFRIINAFENVGSTRGCELLRAVEFHFRPRVNKYLMIERSRFREDPPIEDDSGQHWRYEKPNVFRLKLILDMMLAAIGRLEKRKKMLNDGAIWK